MNCLTLTFLALFNQKTFFLSSSHTHTHTLSLSLSLSLSPTHTHLSPSTALKLPSSGKAASSRTALCTTPTPSMRSGLWTLPRSQTVLPQRCVFLSLCVWVRVCELYKPTRSMHAGLLLPRYKRTEKETNIDTETQSQRHIEIIVRQTDRQRKQVCIREREREIVCVCVCMCV